MLIASVVLGSVLGIAWQKETAVLKPFGDLFLNLLFTAIVPLVFFSISSAVAGMSDRKRFGKIIACMLAVFLLTGMIASATMIIGAGLFPPGTDIVMDLSHKVQIDSFKTSEQIVKAFAAPDFASLLSKQNMLALIVFSILVGLATAASGEKGRVFAEFLTSANDVMMKVIDYIMYYAPIGLCAYFANFVGQYGPDLLGTYFKAMVLYYPVAILYILAALSAYACLAGGRQGLKSFWKNIIPTALTALGTGSSVAAIPANLEAADKTGVPRDISEVVIPIGTTIHKDGSCLGAVVKIAFLFGIFQLDFSGPATLLTAAGIAVLAGTVIAGIPSGGMIGEILIISLYGFPPEVFPVISMIGILIDPPATMVNSMGDNVSAMLVARMMNGKDWMKEKAGTNGCV